MTRYTVTWVKSAEGDLATIWLAASDKQAVTQAANEIDNALAVDPNTKGTLAQGGLRSYYAPPLQVLFRIKELDRIVEVSIVRADPPPPAPPSINGVANPPSNHS